MGTGLSTLKTVSWDEAWDVRDLFEDNDGEMVETEGTYSPYEDETFSNEQHLLIAVIESAVEDCKRIFIKSADKVLSLKEVICGVSAARFLISRRGGGMMIACGFGDTGIRCGQDLGLNTLTALGLEIGDVLKIPQAAWDSAVDTGKFPAGIKYSKKTVEFIVQGAFRFIEADKIPNIKKKQRMVRTGHLRKPQRQLPHLREPQRQLPQIAL